MKRTMSLAALALLASCTQPAPLPALPHAPAAPVHTSAPAPRYVALPGQAPVAVSNDVDAAFDQQVAAYSGQTADVQTPAGPYVAGTDTSSAPVATVTGAPEAIGAIADAAIATGSALQGTVAGVTSAVQPPVEDITAPTGGNMNYKVRITNDTPGRIFVEAQDAAGTIYPCGFMENGRTFTTPMENAAPVKGPITVVVRDPDQPGAPEIRRYKVDPPSGNYNGKAIGINILKGGRYMASVDGQVYYATPVPDEPEPQPNTPAPAPTPAG